MATREQELEYSPHDPVLWAPSAVVRWVEEAGPSIAGDCAWSISQALGYLRGNLRFTFYQRGLFLFALEFAMDHNLCLLPIPDDDLKRGCRAMMDRVLDLALAADAHNGECEAYRRYFPKCELVPRLRIFQGQMEIIGHEEGIARRASPKLETPAWGQLNLVRSSRFRAKERQFRGAVR